MKIKFTLKELRAMLEKAESMAKNENASDYIEIDTAKVDEASYGKPYCTTIVQPGLEFNHKFKIGEITEFGDITKMGAKRIVEALKNIGKYDAQFKFYQLPGDLVGEVIYFMVGPHPDFSNHPFIKEICSDMVVFEIDGERTAFA
jgi:hypothetical protein